VVQIFYSKKGLSDYTSHVLALLIVFMILFVVSSSMYTYYTDITSESKRSQAEAVIREVSNSIMDMYTVNNQKTTVPEPGEKRILASKEIEIRNTIGGRTYVVDLTEEPDPSIVLKVDGNSENYTQKLYNIETGLSGSVSSERDLRIEYTRENREGSITDTVTIEEVGA